MSQTLCRIKSSAGPNKMVSKGQPGLATALLFKRSENVQVAEWLRLHTLDHRVAGSSPTTVKILKIGTPEIITIIVLQLEQLDFTVQYCVQKMQTE